ncbi:uncharacterized protein LOC125521094 [Triticum urartu]|uniref:uncharacterized protein LOC125521094 n=1 Tax=Triticum urartu TaxID=4572 RepID=UPI0020430593|nr:uncharacterized protein LOC125521094 [Triticum urartu]
MEAAANPLLLTTNDLGHGSAAVASLLCLPGCVAAFPSRDLEQQAPDAGGPRLTSPATSQDLQERSASSVQWTVTTKTRTSSMARSSTPTTMIPQRTSKITYFVHRTLLYSPASLNSL